MAWTLELNVNDGYPHNANTRYGNPGLVTPYPDGMWRIQPGVNDGYPHKLGVPLYVPGLHPPLPEYGWKMDGVTNDGYPFRRADAMLPGAFQNCENLRAITIPETVLSIGRYAFWGTALTTVRIAPACEYFPTTFPTDCEIYHYTDGSNLVDSTGRYLMSADKKLLKAKEATNG